MVDRNEIISIDILDGGKGYTSPPDLSLVNPETGTKYDTGLIKAKIQGSAISEIEILRFLKNCIKMSKIQIRIFLK